MKLEEAINLLSVLYEINPPAILPPERDALKLGIEAGKRVQLARKEFGYIDPSLLPGETEE